MRCFLTCLAITAGLLASRPALPTATVHSTLKVAHVTGEINPFTDFSFELEMAATHAFKGPRVILIDSPGGQVDSGNAMIKTLEREKAEGTQVICVVTHQASSMAFNLLTHCDKRYASPKSFMMVHKIALGQAGDGSRRLTAKYLREMARDLDVMDEPFRRANAKAMHLSLKEYDFFADYETIWTAKKLLDIHYLDGIVQR